MANGGITPSPGGPGGGSFLEFIYTLATVGLVFVILIVVELWKYPWQVSAFFAGCIFLGYIIMRFWPHTVKTGQGRAFIYTLLIEGRLVRVFRLGGVYQSATNLGFHWAEPVFAYHRAFDAVFEADRVLTSMYGHGVRRVLALGGGGFAWPKHALLARPDLVMGVVELDPKVIECAEAWFYVERLKKLAKRRLHIIEGDGRAYLEERAELIAQTEHLLPEGDAAGEARAGEPCAEGALEAGASAEEPRAEGAPAEGASTGIAKRPAHRGRSGRPRRTRRFDAIVNDTFTGDEPVRALATVEAARAVRDCLVSGGVYAMNVVSRDDGQDLTFLRDEVATLAEVFAHVHVLPVEETVWAGEDNYIVLATDAQTVFDGTIPYEEDFLGTPMHDEEPA
ncbi:spermidine synthase [Enorma phocaeensis]|uniref:spermidine synthase n=1 Tax=Enorma phocaeensis TaxID=1871019 RepID=UPI002357F8D4|nr:fused MFS/spermidine synthase [Enorma phocaeensis]